MRILKAFYGLVLLVFFGSCEDILEVPDISVENVELLAPSDSTTVSESNVSFSWADVYEATEYHIQVAKPNFESAAQIVLDSVIVIDSTFLGPHVDKSLVDSEYEWRVKAMNSDYQTGFAHSSFTVDTSN